MKNKDGFQNLWKNKVIELMEQIGRFGCFGFMVVTIPGCGSGFSSKETFIIYLIIDSILILAYELIWIKCFNKNTTKQND